MNILAIDIGTTSMRGILYDETGRAICTESVQTGQSFKKLIVGKTIFCFPGIAHDKRADPEISAGIIAAADCFRNAAVLPENIDMRNIIEIDEGLKPARMIKLLIGHGIGREHGVTS